MPPLTICLILVVMLADYDNICEHFEPRSGPKKCRPDLDQNCLTL